MDYNMNGSWDFGGEFRQPVEFNFLNLQNSFIEACEELRFRRHLVEENENKILQLLSEKHQFENKWKEAISKCESIKEEYEQKIKDLESSYKERLIQADIEKDKHNVFCRRTCEEINMLKEDVLKLKMQKMNLERKASDLEAQLMLQANVHHKTMEQVMNFNQLHDSLLKHIQQLSDAQLDLKQSVKGALEVNKNLELKNKQMSSKEKNLLKEKATLSQELVNLRSNLLQVKNDIVPLNHKKEVVKLETEVNHFKEEAEHNHMLLKESREEYMKLLKSLEEANAMVNQYSNEVNELKREKILLSECLHEERKSNSDMKERCRLMERRLSEEMDAKRKLLEKEKMVKCHVACQTSDASGLEECENGDKQLDEGQASDEEKDDVDVNMGEERKAANANQSDEIHNLKEDDCKKPDTLMSS